MSVKLRHLHGGTFRDEVCGISTDRVKLPVNEQHDTAGNDNGGLDSRLRGNDGRKGERIESDFKR